MHRTAKAFTLIEVLVVVALIVLLISLLIPALNGAKQLARQSVCQSTMKNLYEAYRLASMDTNQGRWLPNALATGAGAWTLMARSYAFNGPLALYGTNLGPTYPQTRNNADGGSKMICPNDWPYWQVNVAATNDPVSWNYGPYGDGPPSYAGKANIQAYSSYASNTGVVGSTLSRVLDCCPIGKHRFPAEGILLAENCAAAQVPPILCYYPYQYCTSTVINDGGAYWINYARVYPNVYKVEDDGYLGNPVLGDARHQGKGNMAYLDGHVVAQNPSDVYWLGDSTSLIRWTGTDVNQYMWWLNQ